MNEPQLGRRDKMFAASTGLFAVAITIVGIYLARAAIGEGIVSTIVSLGIVILGGLIFLFTALLVDLVRRGGEARRGMRLIQQDATMQRMEGVALLKYIGTTAAYYIARRQGTATEGMLTAWPEELIMRSYVLPGLKIALLDSHRWISESARDALNEIGTLEAMEILLAAESEHFPSNTDRPQTSF